MLHTWVRDLARTVSDIPEHPDMFMEVSVGRQSPRSLRDFLMFITWILLTPLVLRLGTTRAEVSLCRCSWASQPLQISFMLRISLQRLHTYNNIDDLPFILKINIWFKNAFAVHRLGPRKEKGDVWSNVELSRAWQISLIDGSRTKIEKIFSFCK